MDIGNRQLLVQLKFTLFTLRIDIPTPSATTSPSLHTKDKLENRKSVLLVLYSTQKDVLFVRHSTHENTMLLK